MLGGLQSTIECISAEIGDIWHITFASEKDAQKAIQLLNDVVYKGSPLIARACLNRKSLNFEITDFHYITY